MPCRQNTSFDSTTIMNSLVTASGSLEFWEERLASQPWIAAHSETPTPIEEEIDDYFEDLGFLRIHSVEVAAYYHSETDLVALDAHTQNVLRDENGKLIPIDIVIGHPGERTRKWLSL